jgi:hypothetical protein
MSGPIDIFRARIIHAVVGREVIVVEDIAALNRICERLIEAEQAHAILRQLGYGKPWSTIAELAEMVPHSTAMLIRQKK